MTSGASRRVIEGLSLLRRFALSAGVALVLLHAPDAWAQLPVFAPFEPAPSAPADPPLAPVAPAPVAPVAPVAPAAPPPAAAAPAALPPPPAPPPGPPSAAAPTAPAPAKTDHVAARAASEAPFEEDEEAELEPLPRRRWYGWQTLVADGSSLALILAGAGTADQSDIGETMVTMGLVGYEFAPGIVHFAHGNPGRAFGSFGLRLGMPLAGAFLGAAAASGCDGFLCEAGGAAVGLLLGMGGAIAIDAAVFAYDDADDERDDADEAHLVPQLVLAPRVAWVGLAGRL